MIFNWIIVLSLILSLCAILIVLNERSEKTKSVLEYIKKHCVSFIALFVSIITLCLFHLRISPFNVTNDSIAGFTVGLMGVCATIMVGWQIFSSIEYGKKLKLLEDKISDFNIERYELYDKIDELKKRVEIGLIRNESGIFFVQGLTFKETAKTTSYRSFLNAIYYSLEAGEFDRCNICMGHMKSIILEIEKCIKEKQECKKMLANEGIDKLVNEIISHIEYKSIKYNFEKIEDKRKSIIK